MAESNEQNPNAQGEASQEQDALFRLQMAVTDFILGNWKWAAWGVLALLLGTAIYGGATSFLDARAKDDFAAVAAIDFKMPKIEPMARYGLAPLDDPNDTARLANVEEGGRRYLAAGDDASGAAAALAYLKAAESFDRVGKKDEALAALRKASAVRAGDLPGYTADAALGAALLDGGNTEEALVHYREVASRYKGFFGEQALLRLADAQIGAGRTEDAKATLEEFRSLYPKSPRMDTMAALAARAGSGG